MTAMFPPPDGTEDLESQIEDIERETDTSDEWKYGTVEVRGEDVEIRKPFTNAIHVLAMATAGNVSVKTRDDMISRFVKQHTSERSFERMLERMIDPEDEFTLKDFDVVLRAITTLGTARPTVR